MKPVIIGVGAQMGNGKDVLCNYLAERLNKIYGECWHRDALANNVKRIFCDAFGVDRDFIEEWKRKDTPPPGFQIPVRQGLTFIGDGFRDIQSSIWIDLLLKNNARNLIVSDVRYINEANYIRDHNGLTILLWRPGHESQYQNRSEQELMPFVKGLRDHPDGVLHDENIPFNIWIKNDGTLDDLFTKIDEVIIPYVKDFVGR